MPFNFQDDQKKDQLKEKPKPILHSPKSGNPAMAKALVGLFVILVIGAALYLVERSGILSSQKTTAHVEEMRLTPLDTAQITESQPMDPAATETQRVPRERAETIQAAPERQPAALPEPEQEKRQAADGGKFTIYAGSFKKREVTEGVVSELRKRGHNAFVVPAGEWYRVAVGKFETREAARAHAETLRSALESGFWVEKVP